MPSRLKQAEYDSVPVKYCAKCLSLKIKYEETIDSEYCGECGCTDIVESSIEDWEKKYEVRYGKKFVERGKDITKHPIFLLNLNELKKKLYDSPNWKSPIKNMFPNFPEGFSKTDTILLFFDYLLRENKLDDFRILMIKLKI